MLLNRKTTWCTAFGISIALAAAGSVLSGRAYAQGSSESVGSENQVAPKFNEKIRLEVRESLRTDSMIHDAE